MKAKANQPQPPQSSSIVDDKATDRLKQHLQDWGVIVNAGASKTDKPAVKKKDGKRTKLPRS